ncbi:MAG: hypothetical protein J5828_05185, partial [Desulfovibrionaceae bacterium]|nr:hypothetical protein [Desulfovibrionaceae bacterium]
VMALDDLAGKAFDHAVDLIGMKQGSNGHIVSLIRQSALKWRACDYFGAKRHGARIGYSRRLVNLFCGRLLPKGGRGPRLPGILKEA